MPQRLRDTEARDRIRNSLDENLIVEAAAGTGKTSELVRRIIAVLQKGKTEVNRIVAVTFTRKAAGELKLRLRQELDRARSGTVDPQERRNLEVALAQLEEARVGTIHSFCADILRERPVEARVDPAFGELSEDEAPRLYEQVFRAWIQEKLQEMPVGLRRALSRAASQTYLSGHSPLDGLRDAGWKLIEWRDFPASWKREPWDRIKNIDELVEKLRQIAGAVSRCRNPSDYLYQALAPARTLATWIERAEAVRSRDYDALEARLIHLLKALNRQKNKKGRGFFGEGISRQELLDAREQLLGELEQFQIAANADLAALLRDEMWELVDRYEQIKRRDGSLDFVDLLLRVRDLVRDNRDVRQYLQKRFTHLFVDEFQDTDPLQVEILLLLSADDPTERDWRRVRPTPGKLFLVGDPKQSIYRFRRADVLLYQEVKDVLTSRGAGLVLLSTSFRATRPIQQFVNSAFEPEMNGDPLSGQPAYVPLESEQEEMEEGEPPPEAGPYHDQPQAVVLPVPKPYGFYSISKEAVEGCLPDTIAAFLVWLLKESGWRVRNPENPEQYIALEGRHVCILFRRFMSWGEDVTRDYVRALEVRGVPHLLVGGKSFHRREEVETVRAALTAIEWPDDELSVFATLKGSLFAISDSVLLRFRHAFGTLHPFHLLPEELEETFAPVREALNLLAELHRRRNWRPIVETVNALLDATRSHAGFALRPAGNQALANVQRICDLARSFEVGGGISFRGFVEQLTREAEKQESAEAPLLEEGAEGVRLMTVHAAKGLEFPIVILADITANLAHNEPDKYVDVHAGLCATRLLGCSPWDLIHHQDEEKARDRAEGVRIAYVATTRARDLLVIPAVGDGNKEGWWLGALDKAIYPLRERWRMAEKAPGCPEFGETSVLLRPPEFDGMREGSVKPGLHRIADRTVLWWDPALLRLNVEGGFGLRQETILAEDKEGAAATEGLRKYEEWKERRGRAIEAGTKASFDVATVTQVMYAPEAPVEITTESLEQVERPSGSRFGTLVHTVLRDVDFSATEESVRSLAVLHGRVLGSTDDEVAAATQAVLRVLQHSIIARARSAERLHRELPVVIQADQKLIEGTIDLAFREHGTWTVVDFKTDAALENRRLHYQRQLSWYVHALSRITGSPARGILLAL